VKVLNLYAGIGGNRKLWGGCEVVAVELNPSIAAIYQDFYPKDKVVVGDAHQYLLEHFREFDFIWSSPPCPTHSRINFLHNHKGLRPKYPDMKLYEEILLLKHWFKGKWVVENVKSYYDPLIHPQESARHYFWANFRIRYSNQTLNIVRNDKGVTLKVKMEAHGFMITDWHGYKGDKRTLLNNVIEPELGLKIFEQAAEKELALL
jgi:DNA (cytosine-5)-methyltransferase 1